MKKLFIADKSSYGAEFYNECNTLEELKKEIVLHELRWEGEYSPEMYTEELFKEHSTDYTLYEIDLHDDEYIEWHEYDGASWFKIQKRVPNLLSKVTEIKGE